MEEPGSENAWTGFRHEKDGNLAPIFSNDCYGCLRSLYGQLRRGSTSIDITDTDAGSCPSVMTRPGSDDACLEVLDDFISTHPGMPFSGIYGGNCRGPTKRRTLVIYTTVEDLGDANVGMIRAAISVDPEAGAMGSFWCQRYYGEILGPDWLPVKKINSPDKIELVEKRVKRALDTEQIIRF
jgi:hypothetical protein